MKIYAIKESTTQIKTPIQTMNSNMYTDVNEDCYSHSYYYYKLYQCKAKQAANNREYFEAMRGYLAAARGRKNHRDKYFNGVWDEGHRVAYENCVSNAWLQKKYWLNDPNDYDICYERN